jgi:hypothetical protein
MDQFVTAMETAPKYLFVPVKLVAHSAHHYATVVGVTTPNVNCLRTYAVTWNQMVVMSNSTLTN